MTIRWIHHEVELLLAFIGDHDIFVAIQTAMVTNFCRLTRCIMIGKHKEW